jgi:hypothetical protein
VKVDNCAIAYISTIIGDLITSTLHQPRYRSPRKKITLGRSMCIMLALQTVAQASKARPSVTQPMQPSEGVSAAAAAAVTQPTAPSTETIPADGSHENDTLNSFHIKFDPTINPSQFAFDLRDENADSDPDISEESSIQQRSSPINTDFDLDGPPSAS